MANERHNSFPTNHTISNTVNNEVTSCQQGLGGPPEDTFGENSARLQLRSAPISFRGRCPVIRSAAVGLRSR